MPVVNDLNSFGDRADEATLAAAAQAAEGQFSRGMRSGGNAAMASLNNLAGAVGQKVGAADFAAGRFSAADQYTAAAAAAAPRVASMRDVGSVGDFADYAKGLAGGMVPVGAAALGAGLLTGGGAVPAMLAGTGVMAPVEAGDIVGRMREAGQPIDLTRAAVGGVGSAALQNVLPGVARAKLGGAAGRIPGGALAAIPEQAVLGGVSEAGKQYAANPQAPLDWHQAGEAAAGGAVMGVPIAGMHALGSNRAAIGSAADKLGGAVKDAAQFVGDKAKGVAQATGDAADAAMEAAGPVAQAAGAKVKAGADAAAQQVKGMELPEALSGLYDGAKAKGREVLDRIAKSDDLVGDVTKFAGLQGDKLKQAIAGDDGERIQALKDYAKELGDQHPAVRDWLTDAGNHTKQAAVAAAKQARDAYTTARDHLTKFADSAKQRADDKEGSAKKSEDDSGIRQAMADKLIPELLKARPELAAGINDPKQAAQIASDLHRGFAPLIEELSSGRQPSSDTIARLIDLAGPATDRLIEVAHSVVGDSTNPAKTRAFFKGLNDIAQVRDSSDTLVQTLRKNLAKGQERMTDAELREEAALLAKWRDDKRPTDGPNADPVAQRLNYTVQKHLEARYGKNADKVLAALEKSRKSRKGFLEGDEDNAERNRDIAESDEADLSGDEDNPTGEANIRTTRTRQFDDVRDNVRVFTNKGGLYPHPEKAQGKNGQESATKQAMDRVQRQNPDMEVTWRSAAELGPDHEAVRMQRRALTEQFMSEGHDQDTAGSMADKAMKDYGVITAEGSKQETRLNSEELQKVTLDAKKYGDSKSRLEADVGGKKLILDAAKLTDFMHRKLAGDYSEWDDKSQLHRKARMFMEGVAAVQEHIKASVDAENVQREARGEPLLKAKPFDIPDETVIDKHGTTWGDVATETGWLKRGVKGLTVKGKNSEMLTADRHKLIGAAMKLEARIQELNAQRTMGPDGKLRPFKYGSAEGKELWTAEKDLIKARTRIESLKAQADTAKMYELLDEAGQADGGYPKDSTIRGIIDELGDSPVAKLMRDYLAGRGDSDGYEPDPFGNVHAALNGGSNKAATIRSNMSGVEGRVNDLTNAQKPAAKSHPRATREPEQEPPPPVKQRIGADREYGNKSWPALRRAAAEAARAFKDPNIDTDTLGFTHAGKDYSIRQLRPDQWQVLDANNEVIHSIGKASPKEEPAGPKAAAAKKAAFLERARSGDESLIKEIGQHTDAVALQNAVVHLARKGDVNEPNTARAIDALNARIGELVKGDPQQAYDMLRANKSMEPADPNRQGPVSRKEVRDYLTRTLGNSINVEWAKLGHAGEFERIERPNAPVEDVIRLSVHAMNPLSTAFHESMHGFIQKLSDMKHGQIVDVLFKAGESAPTLNQLRTWMTERGMGEKALAQLHDPEERAAYMYQAWADGKLKVGDQTKTVLGKIADFIRSVLGIWSNDERALHIMEYFHSGEFAKNLGNRDKVGADLMNPGRNKAVEVARKMTQPILELGENLGVAGGQRLRDTGIPALRELADMMKLHTVAEGDDAGFIPAARAERTRVMNKLAADMKDYSQEAVQAALESLQQQSNAPIAALARPEDQLAARQAKTTVRKLLDGMYGYMTAAGVKVNDLGVGKDYFPRVYDTSYISSHQQEFKNVLARHGVANPDKVLAKLMVAEGAEFTVEVSKPGMQHLKPRDLAHIPEAELAPFMRKDLVTILSSYVTQATRRAEWARRFGDDGKGVDELLIKAKRQGATPDDLDSAQKFVKAVDGTLGDTINPEARRLFGNMIVYQNVRLLPLMIFSSLVDPLGITVRGGTVGDAFAAFKRGISEIPKNFKKSPTDDAATKFAASIGVIDDTTLVHTLGALYSQGMVGDTGRKINDTLFRYNLAEQFNTSMRVSATEAAMGFLARHADGTVSPHSRRWLGELGLNPGELKLDANGRVKVTEADGLTAAESIKVKAAINRWVDGAVLRPDAADKPIWMSDPHFALIAHLKQFTYSFHETILKRVAHEYQNGNYTPAMALASYVPMMIAADMAKGLIQGGGEEPSWKQNWGMADYIESGIERAGLLGVGQFGVDMLRDAVRGGTGVGALAGPTIEQFAEAAKMLGGRESFGQFALKSMPANALYAAALGGEATDPKFVD